MNDSTPINYDDTIIDRGVRPDQCPVCLKTDELTLVCSEPEVPGIRDFKCACLAEIRVVCDEKSGDHIYTVIDYPTLDRGVNEVARAR